VAVAGPNRRRRALSWALSLVGGGAFLWLASLKLRLWPEEIVIVSPWLLALGVALHVPYALVRSMRLQYVFDPLVAEASGDPDARLDRRVLYGSGLVSFFVLIVLPFKLGELSRPVLLDRGRQPGLRVTEAITGVALERLVDGLLICVMLFGGLALSQPREGLDAMGLADLRAVGLSMLGVFAVGLAVLLVSSRDPSRAASLARSLTSLFGAGLSDKAGSIVHRFAVATRGILELRRAARFAAWSVIYWGITTAQLWLVLQASGVPLGLAESAAIVAIVGLAIQLPGGPAQAGTFQAGTSVSLSLFLAPEVVAGAGSTFAAVMYLLQFFGAAVLALPGLALMASATRDHDASSADSAASEAPEA
jgi:uncharacterized membrane protein YbhN (UPF0104 family)